jgi:hypothetical protein
MEQAPWTDIDRRHVRWLLLLPAASAAVFTALWAGGAPGLWPVMLAFCVVGAYATLAVGVAPLLLMFRRRGWQGWASHAAGGYLGVVLPWGLPAWMLGRSGGDGVMGTLLALSVPGAIAACAAILYWFVCVRAGEPGRVA